MSVRKLGCNMSESMNEGHIHSIAFPFIFVMLYGTGFVGAKYGLPYAEPVTFLVWRFAIAACVVAGIGLFFKANWPKSWREAFHISVAGMLTVGTFSLGVFVAIDMGLSPALSALIIALQPVLVAVVARRMLGESLKLFQWLGLVFGLIGIVFVVSQKLDFTSVHMTGLGMAVIGLLGLSFGNLYQKRFCADMNIFSGGAIQSFASCVMCLPFAFAFETMQVEWSVQFIGALGYMSIGVSVGALSLLYVMIRRGEVSRVASIFYFVPVSAALVSSFLFEEKIDLPVAIGISITALGVMLVNRQSKK
ncbi:DMT family transporter [Terasakiella sp.]|uniref:DMT family transporter n=1 Tax=Terasakiella sp. TaxID=2034861 RepID=UPI003AA90098